MNVLIVGSKGQLGHDLMYQAQLRGWDVSGADLPDFDITDAKAIQTLFHTDAPYHVLINAAAYTAVDAAQSDAQTAFAVNRDGAKLLAQECAKHQLPMIHVSTDYVFDGIKTSPYLPEDAMAPQGVYGRSKAEGENEIRCALERHVIVRTSWLFGLHGNNFVKTMIRLGTQKTSLQVIDDQVGCPTYAGDLAAALLDIAAYVNTHQNGWGTYHFCNDVAVTWYAFARRILALARSYERLTVSEIIPILTIHYTLPAPRPHYSVLDCQSLEQRFGIARRPWEKALREMLTQLYDRQLNPASD